MKFKRQINNIIHLHRRLTISREIPLARVRRSQGSAVRGTRWDSTFTASLTSCQFFGSRPLTVCFQRFQVETRFQPQCAKGAKSYICSINLSLITFAKSHVSFLSGEQLKMTWCLGQDRSLAESSSSSRNQCSDHWSISFYSRWHQSSNQNSAHRTSQKEWENTEQSWLDSQKRFFFKSKSVN